MMGKYMPTLHYWIGIAVLVMAVFTPEPDKAEVLLIGLLMLVRGDTLALRAELAKWRLL